MGRLRDRPLPKHLSVEEFKARLEEIVTEWQLMEEGHLLGWKEGHKEGMKEGLQRGFKEGFQKGGATLLLRLLKRKFGRLDPQTRAQVRGADTEHLLTWGERVLTAERLEDVFTN